MDPQLIRPRCLLHLIPSWSTLSSLSASWGVGSERLMDVYPAKVSQNIRTNGWSWKHWSSSSRCNVLLGNSRSWYLYGYHVTKASHPDQMHPRMAATLIGGSDPTLVPAAPTKLRRNGKNVTKSSRFWLHLATKRTQRMWDQHPGARHRSDLFWMRPWTLDLD